MAAKRPFRTLIVVAAGLLLITVVPGAISLYVDWLWFSELGYTAIFTTELFTKLALLFGVGVLATGFLLLNLRYAQRHLSPHPVRLRAAPNQEPVELAQHVRRLSTGFAVFFGLMTGLAAMGYWLPVLQWLNAHPFGIVDPVLGRDVGFYIFSLPVLEWVLAIIFSLCVVACFALAGIYWVRGDLVLYPRRIVLDPRAATHAAVIVALLLVVIALRNYFVAIPQILFTSSEQLQGAGYTDIHARIPALTISSIVALLGAGFVVWGAVRRKALWHMSLAAGAYVLVSILGTGVYPAALQRFLVAPSEITYEQPQIANHIALTRRAWDIDSVLVRDLSGDATLTAEHLLNNTATIENVRLWDRDPLLQTFGQLQEIRTYYDFVSVDDDRYMIDGRYRQVLLSPRELNSASLPARNFINQHLVFTHGMGLTLSPVNQVTAEGLPVLFVRDLPPESGVSLRITRPQIYFGEITNEFAIVNTRQPEFDYPAGEGQATTTYNGKAGILLKSLLRRALLATHFQTMNILLSNEANNNSRLLFRRSIMERARHALPFIRFDADPYMVITDDGLLKWILDGYTSSSRFPYSRRLMDGAGTNYMRNSVKVVIDAYDGTVDAYVSDPDDPIIQSFIDIFPDILQPLESLAPDLQLHLRYPEELFRAQTSLYRVYHMTDPNSFYNREDEWQIASLDENQGPSRSPFLRYIVMRLPEEDSAEFIFMTPYTPRGKDNLAAWLVARNDGENYGELVVYRFPKQSLVYGPRQVVNRMNQDTEIARQITLWDQRGSQVIRGQLLVIPIEESLIYVQPIYLRAEGGRIPELKRVVVAYQNRVVMDETLERALDILFGGDVGAELAAVTGAVSPTAGGTTANTATGTGTSTLDQRTLDLLREAQTAYDRALAAQRAGNWAEYGSAIQRVGEIIRSLGGRIPPG